jgi:hypothetical protein
MAGCPTTLDDPHLALGFGDFEFGDVGLRHQVDQRLQLAQIHVLSRGCNKMNANLLQFTLTFCFFRYFS